MRTNPRVRWRGGCGAREMPRTQVAVSEHELCELFAWVARTGFEPVDGNAELRCKQSPLSGTIDEHDAVSGRSAALKLARGNKPPRAATHDDSAASRPECSPGDRLRR